MLVEKAASCVRAAVYLCESVFRQFSLVQKPLSGTVCHTKYCTIKCPLRTVRYRAVAPVGARAPRLASCLTSPARRDNVPYGGYILTFSILCDNPYMSTVFVVY